MSTPTTALTIAILTYNREGYLRECLESLTKQTFTDFEVIIFDNASDYDVSSFLKEFPGLRIRVDANEKNIGGINNFLKVISYPFTSPYVMMFHDDDTIHPSYLEKACGLLASHDDVVWVGSDITFVPHATHEKMTAFEVVESTNPFTIVNDQELIIRLMKGFNLGFGSIIYRREVLEKAISRHEEFDKWLDRPFAIDLALSHTVALSTERFINYRIHDGQDSQFIEPKKLQCAINLFRYYKEKKNNPSSYFFRMLLSNSAINTAFHVASTYAQFFAILREFKKAELFSWYTIGPRGILYLCKFIYRNLKSHLA